jgi:nitroreductase
MIDDRLYFSLLKIVTCLQSVDRFKSHPVHDEYEDQKIEVARWAPTGTNLQPSEFVVIKRPENYAREKQNGPLIKDTGMTSFSAWTTNIAVGEARSTAAFGLYSNRFSID